CKAAAKWARDGGAGACSLLYNPKALAAVSADPPATPYDEGSISMLPRHRAIVMLLVALVVWGSTFVVTKEVVEQVPPLTLALLRVAIGALTLLPVVLVRRRAANAGAALPWGTIVAMAFIGVALYYALFNLALF